MPEPNSNFNTLDQQDKALLLGNQPREFPMHFACFINNTKEVSLLLSELQLDPNQLNSTGNSPKHIAAACGNIDVLRLLLHENSYVKMPNTDGNTALQMACAYGNVECARLLLTYNSDINAKNNKQLTSLHLASKKGCIETVKLLLACRADPHAVDNCGLTALHFACFKGHTDVVKKLLQRNYKVNLNVAGAEKTTPLHFASENGHYGCVQLLLSRGAKVDATDSKMATALHRSCYQKHYEIAKLLLDSGANIEAEAKRKLKPIHFACGKGSVQCIQLLLERGALVDPKAENDLTPLHIVCDKNHLEAAQLLLQNNANPNSLSDSNATALHFAAMHGHVNIVNLLLDSGVDCDVKNRNGERAWNLAIKNGHSSKLPRLKELQSSFECFSSFFNTLKLPSQPRLRSSSNPDVSLTGSITEIQQLNNRRENIQCNLPLSLKIIQELISTECKFVGKLSSVINHYLIPFELPANQSKIPAGLRGQSSKIFGNIQELYDFHNRILLPDLMCTSNAPGQFCQVFITHQDFLFGLYVQYCNRVLPQSQALCQQHGANSCKFILQCQKEANHQLPLSSYLIEPFQRIQRYPLLLKELSKGCIKDSSITQSVQDTINEAVALMLHVLSRINGATEQENQELREQLSEERAKNLQREEFDTWIESKLSDQDNDDAGPSTSSGSRANEMNCNICTVRKKNTAVYRCGHTFCSICIREINKTSTYCPNCRGEIEHLLTLY